MKPDLDEARRRIEQARELPALFEIAERVRRHVDDPRAGPTETSDLVSLDPALTAAALRVVNSAYYGLERRIGNIGRAMVVLGFERVKSLARHVAEVASDDARGEGDPGPSVAAATAAARGAFDPQGLWAHALATGVAARALALRVAANWAEDAFAAGLLHDMGKLALAVAFPERWGAVVAAAKAGDGRLVVEVEREHFGFDHAVAGGWLAEKWRFPEPLIQAITHHHTPGAARSARELVAVVHAADVLVRGLGLGDPGDGLVPPVDPAAWERMAFDGQAALEGFLGEVLEAFDRATAPFEARAS